MTLYFPRKLGTWQDHGPQRKRWANTFINNAAQHQLLTFPYIMKSNYRCVYPRARNRLGWEAKCCSLEIRKLPEWRKQFTSAVNFVAAPITKRVLIYTKILCHVLLFTHNLTDKTKHAEFGMIRKVHSGFQFLCVCVCVCVCVSCTRPSFLLSLALSGLLTFSLQIIFSSIPCKFWAFKMTKADPLYIGATQGCYSK